MCCKRSFDFFHFDRFDYFAKLGFFDHEGPHVVTKAVGVQLALEVNSVAHSRRQSVVNRPVKLHRSFLTRPLK